MKRALKLCVAGMLSLVSVSLRADDEVTFRSEYPHRMELSRSGSAEFPEFPTRRRGGTLNRVVPLSDSEDDFRREPVTREEGLDPFIPAPTPKAVVDDESERIKLVLTGRYSNPATVRAVRALSGRQATELFTEVSNRIDERSLEPTSYDVRVRRALRNLGLALDNEAFIRGLRISSDSFRTDAFRESLGRLAGRMTVRNRSDAAAVMNAVMKESERVSGLTASVVAWEFALASLDTLDKFSGLDPADPDVRRGAEAEGWQTAALDEEIVGIGVEVREHADGLLVVKPLKGSPAAEAGLRSGDVVTAIDGRKIAGLKMTESSDLMKGTAGSRIVLAVTREDGSERSFTIVRRKVRIWTVNDVRMLNSAGTAYLSLSRFSAGSTAELDAALESLYSRGMKSLVLDLRGNPGGLLTTCVEIADRFLPVGTIVSTRGRLSSDNMVEKATFARTWSMPLVVLIDGDSASASEIFAAAIQENRRGVVVGVKSYGKGSVQTHFPLNSISGDLRITTALFYSPNGRRMAGAGVSPDVEVLDRDGVANGDRMLLEAERLASSTELLSLARAAARVRPADPAKPRSAALESIADPVGGRTAVH